MKEDKSERIEETKSTFKAPLSRKQKRAIERASLKLSGVKPKYQ